MTSFILKAIPATVLLLTAIFSACSGVVFIGNGLTFTGSGAGPGAVAFGVALIAAAAGLLVLAIGVWRLRPWALKVGMAAAAAGAMGCAWVARTAFDAHGFHRDDATGRFVTDYDTGAMAIALAFVPFALALICLLIAELRLQHRPNPHP